MTGIEQIRRDSLASRPIGSTYRKDNYRLPFFVRAVAYAALVLAVLWPRYLFFSVFGIGVNPFTLVVLLGAPAAIVFMMLRPRGLTAMRHLIRLNPLIMLAFLLLIGLRLLSCFSGQQVSISIQSFIRDLPTFLLFILLGIAFIDNGVRARFPSLLLGLAAVQLILAIVEFNVETSIAGMLRLNEIGVGDAGAMAQVGTDRVRDGAYRAQALFGHPIVQGQFAAALLPLTVTMIYRRGIGAKLGGGLLMLLSIAGAYVSGTRSALLLLAVGAVVFFVMSTHKTRYSVFSRAMRIYIVLIVALFATALFSDNLTEMVAGRTATEVSSTQTRQVQIEYSTEAIEAKPIMGYGLGNGIDHSGIINGFGQQTLDNFFLSIALDTGLAGLASFLMLSLLAVGAGLAAVNRTLGSERHQAAALLAFYVVLLVGHSVQSIIDTLSFELIALAWLINAGRNLLMIDTRSSR